MVPSSKQQVSTNYYFREETKVFQFDKSFLFDPTVILSSILQNTLLLVPFHLLS